MDNKIVYRVIDDSTEEVLADITYDKTAGNYSANLLTKGGRLPIVFGFPISGSRPNPSSCYLEAFLEDRVVPSNRDWIDKMLAQNNIVEYDWHELIKLNHGRRTDDSYRVEVLK